MDYIALSIHIGCTLFFIAILLYLERDNLEELPKILIFIFGLGGFTISYSVIYLLQYS